MRLTSIIAIYLLFWVLAAFFVMPFGIRTHDDAKADLVEGQVSSAPINFNPKRIARRATILSLLMFGLYYANYVNGWLTVDDIDVTQWSGAKQD
ncbi:MAG: DUF1467 family protein [Novosphingobium sp.]